MSRTRAADDFDTIRRHLEQLRRERAPKQPEPAFEPDAVAHVPPSRPTIPVPSSTNRPGAV